MNILNRILGKERYYALWCRYWGFIKYHLPYLWAKKLYRDTFGKDINFNNPKDLNEKILWLSHYTDTREWSRLADKYAVREFVRERVGDQYLVPLIGKWDRVEDIDFASLPQKFAMKPNNGSYDSIICTNKEELNIEECKTKLGTSLTHKFGYENAEPHYLRIKPCIIAEKLLETDAPEGLVDYKVWCFNGEPYCFFICFNRNPVTHTVEYSYYDLNWIKHEDYVPARYGGKSQCPKPDNLSELLDVARKLAQGFPQARVDLYDVDGKIYFGEMTFTSNFGMMPYFTQEVLNDMGDQCILPKRSLYEKVWSFCNRWFANLFQ